MQGVFPFRRAEIKKKPIEYTPWKPESGGCGTQELRVLAKP